MWEWDALLPGALAGVAAALWLRDPAGYGSRAAGLFDPVQEPGPWGRAGARLLTPRADSAPLRQRILVASAGAVAVAVGLRPTLGSTSWLAWLAVPVLAVCGVLVLGRLEPRGAKERHQRLVLELPQALDLMAACLAAGLPLRQATAAVAAGFEGPVADDLLSVLVRIDLGASDVEAWRSLRGHPQWGAAAVDLARSAESGTMLVDVLTHHARDARARRRAALEVRARSVGVRSVLPLMTCFLPAFMLVGVVPTVASAIGNALF